MAMRVQHGSTGVRYASRGRATWIVVIAGLLITACQVFADETGNELTTAKAWGIGTASAGVDDAVLNAVYGKGYPEQALRTEVHLSVILWDEGKRKVPIQGTTSGVVMYGHSDVHLQGTGQPR